MLVVIAKREDNVVTVLSLKSGVPRLTINASMAVYSLGVIRNTVVAIGSQKVIIWDLPAEDCAPGARVGEFEDSSSTIRFYIQSLKYLSNASISPDSRHIAVCDLDALYIHSGSTGELLWEESTSRPQKSWFSPDGSDLWCIDRSGKTEVWGVKGERRGPELLERTAYVEFPPEGYPWASSRGYRVTDDWWILGPGGKRLLMLPPPWQSYAMERRWEGQFLALLHRGLPEPVILELEAGRDL